MGKRVVVYHEHYGCDTGCCGHAFYLDGEKSRDHFTFEHPGGNEDFRTWATRILNEAYGDGHAMDLDWENSRVIDD